MDITASHNSRERFEAYITAIVISHADREEPLHDYCPGLLLSLERKSIEPLAAHTAPGNTGRNTSRCCILSATLAGRTRPC